jgi:hypothetical protein
MKNPCILLAAGVYLSETPLPSYDPIPPPLTHCICVYLYSILSHTGKGGGANKREGQKASNSSQNWVENTNMIDCFSSL